MGGFHDLKINSLHKPVTFGFWWKTTYGRDRLIGIANIALRAGNREQASQQQLDWYWVS